MCIYIKRLIVSINGKRFLTINFKIVDHVTDIKIISLQIIVTNTPS